MKQKLFRYWSPFVWLGAMLLVGASVEAIPASAQPGRSTVFVLEIDGAIGPATAEYIANHIEKARDENASLIILRMDTPGGLDTAMRDIIQDILAAPIPVASFVAPRGARAASAGTYILYASHIAAMAPGTNLGAATPVQLQGPPTQLPGTGDRDELAPEGGGEKSEGGKEGQKDSPGGDAMTAKAINDAAAYIESLADMRGRNAEWAVKAVREARSLPAEEAVEKNVVDLMANDIPDLIAKISGREVELATGTVTLRLENAIVSYQNPNWRTRLLEIITDPNVALILMMIGVYGLILEFYNPGAVLPGMTGAISLLLALYALNVLPVNYAGLALMLLGMGLMVAEAFAPSFGILGIGGGAAFLLGATLLFDMDAPGFELSMPMLVGTAVVGGGLMILVMTMAIRAQRRPVTAGEESALGSNVTVLNWADGSGEVEYHGERWHAVSDTQMRAGQRAVVTDRQGLTLNITPVEAGQEQRSS